MHTSGAVMMSDLADELVNQGHQVSVVVPLTSLKNSVALKNHEGIKIFCVRVLSTKDVHFVFRAFAEWLNPYLIWFHLSRFTPFTQNSFDGLAWYSPSIFWSPFIKRAKTFFNCPSYLILRDIFPDWALDLGVIKPGLQYRFLKGVQGRQYEEANRIGVQSPNNLSIFIREYPHLEYCCEVLWNWGSPQTEQKKSVCSIDLTNSSLAGRTLFLYAGNMGLAQGIDVVLNIAKAIVDRSDIGFVLVGRGSELLRLRDRVKNEKLGNVEIYDEIPSAEMQDLYTQCHVGIVSLDLRHTTHNIPGKFVSYMQAGMPVLAIVNSQNDLLEFIKTYQLGVAFNTHSQQEILAGLDQLLVVSKNSAEFKQRCKAFYEQYFSVVHAAKQIESGLYLAKQKDKY